MLSTKAKKKLEVAVGDKAVGGEIVAAIQQQAATVATLAPTATAADCAAAINAIIAAMQAAGLMK
jgi:Ni,Fe-hydrogenase III small subunit